MKRFAKSAVMSIAKRRRTLSSSTLAKSMLGLLGVDFEYSGRVKYPEERGGACVISLDFDHITKSLREGSSRWYPRPVDELLAKNRNGTKEMLAVSEKYSIPMTWAICGQTAEADPESYNSIRSHAGQEIGVHTYSHMDVASCSEEELRDEVAKCLSVLNLPEHPRTFIFPWNRLGHFGLLRQLGFLAYRDKMRIVGAPREYEKMVNLPPTYYVDIKSYKAQALIKKYLDFCISWNAVFHLWLHPWSVVFDGSDRSGRFVRETMDPLFSYIKEKREAGELVTCTMGELATFWTKRD